MYLMPFLSVGINEKAFITGVMKESAFNEAAEKAGHIINRIRLD